MRHNVMVLLPQMHSCRACKQGSCKRQRTQPKRTACKDGGWGGLFLLLTRHVPSCRSQRPLITHRLQSCNPARHNTSAVQRARPEMLLPLLACVIERRLLP